MNSPVAKVIAESLPPLVKHQNQLPAKLLLPVEKKVWVPPKDVMFPRIRRYRSLQRQMRRRHIGIGNFYRLEIVGHFGSRWLTPWFHNNITDTGLDLCATSEVRYNACQVGTGNTAPTDADTGLAAYTAGTTTRVTVSSITQRSTTPYYTEVYFRYDFPTGAVDGNMQEVMVGTLASGGDCFSRELIRDSGGSPTSITVSSSQALRVHYKVRHYAPVDDVAGMVTIDPDDHDTLRRAIGLGTTAHSSAWSPNAPLFGLSRPAIAYSGALVTAISNTPTGQLGSSDSLLSQTAYSPGSFARTYTAVWSTLTGNGDIRTILHHGGRASATNNVNPAQFQTELDPVLTKTSLDELALDFAVSWGRYVP